jgi:hypothetical protein
MSSQDADDGAGELIGDGVVAGGTDMSCARLLRLLTGIAQADQRHGRAARAAAKFQDSRFHEIQHTACERWAVLIQIKSESRSADQHLSSCHK